MTDLYKQQAYWYPSASRVTAEQILRKSPAGSFLLRPSSQPGAVAMSIKQPVGIIDHALIQFRDNAYHIQLARK